MSVEKMSDRVYYDYKSVIEEANSRADKDALRKIKYDIMTKYEQNRDTEYLLGMFRYTV